MMVSPGTLSIDAEIESRMVQGPMVHESGAKWCGGSAGKGEALTGERRRLRRENGRVESGK